MGLVACQECKHQISNTAKVCPQCGAKQRRTSAFTKVVTGLFGLTVIAVAVSDFSKKRVEDQHAANLASQAASAAAVKAKQVNQLRNECPTKREELVSQYQAAMKARKFTDAIAAARPCAEATGDAEFTKMVSAARLADLRAVVDNKSAAPQSRLNALEAMKREFPADYQGSEKLMATLTSQALAAAAAEEKKKAARIAAEKRKQGVSIGMTREDVLASSWGRPDHINRSTYSWGTHEQWVYGSGNYLYFRNGILESIQN